MSRASIWRDCPYSFMIGLKGEPTMRKIAHLFLLIMIAFGFSARAQGERAYEMALERIQRALETGATELNLNTLSLTRLPPEIGQLVTLEQLDLSYNQLTELPPEIGQLRNLWQLFVDGNPLTSPPRRKWSNREPRRCWNTCGSK